MLNINVLHYKLSMLIIGVYTFVAFPCHAGAPTASEYQIKSVFLYNFVNFIDWPDSAFDSSSSPFNLCVFGKNPFGAFLKVATDNQKAGQHPIKLHYLDHTSQISICHILYISDTQPAQIQPVLHLTQKHPILTVSDEKDFISLGGMVNFFKISNKVRLAMNPDAIKKAKLKASANLLKLAKITKR